MLLPLSVIWENGILRLDANRTINIIGLLRWRSRRIPNDGRSD